MIDYFNGFFDWNLFRRDVRRDVRNCAICLFLFYAFNLIATGIIEGILVANKVAAATFSQGDFSFEDLTQTVLDGKTIGILSIVGMIAGSMAFLILRKKRFFTDIALPSAERLRPWVFIILVIVTQGIQVATGLISSLVEELLPQGISIIGNYESVMEMLISPAGLVYVVLVGPIFEELIFRGAVMGPLRKYGDNFAILFSSLLFGLYHGVVLQIPFAFAMGLVLGYACTRWSLRTAIALHIISNGLSVLLSIEAFAIPGGLFLYACGIMTIILFFVYRVPFTQRMRAGMPYYGRVTYTYGFSSIAFWLFTAAMIAFAVFQLIGGFSF